jgi:hypothetical protein
MWASTRRCAHAVTFWKEGRLDDVPVEAFYFAGGIEEIRKRAAAAQ